MTKLLSRSIAGRVQFCHELGLAADLVDMFDQGRNIVAIPQEARPFLCRHRRRNIAGQSVSDTTFPRHYLVRILQFASFGFLLGCPPTRPKMSTNVESNTKKHVAKKNDDTYTRYNEIAIMIVRQYVDENPSVDPGDLSYPELSLDAVTWFTECHERWRKSYIRLTAAALTQWIENLGHADLMAERAIKRALADLKIKRPKPILEKPSGYAKSIKNVDLRRLIGYFRRKGDAFSLWIAGYLQVASRIGWRPGEVVKMYLEGIILHAPAEKHTNERSLRDICEIGLNEYPPFLILKLGRWISDTEHWADECGGHLKLRDRVRARVARACEELEIKRNSLYSLRHFAIACMKASGLSREEIAIIVTTLRTGLHRRNMGRHAPA